MRPKFKTNGKKTVFVDNIGREWTEDNLQDLVDSVKNLKKAVETGNYYF